MTKQIKNELRLVQLLYPDISDERKFEILKELDITYTITGNTSAFEEKNAFLGYNGVHIAAIKSDLNLTQEFLNLGANILQQGAEDNKTPLRKAVDYVKNDLETPVWELTGTLQERCLINILLSAQVHSNNPLNARCKSGISHFHIACMYNHVQAVQFFANVNKSLDQAISFDSSILPGYTPLHCAIRYSSLEAATVLLKLGGDIYLENAQHINSVCYLVERLLNVNDNLRMTISSDSHCAPFKNDIVRLDSILKAIVWQIKTDDSKLVEITGLSAFHLACMLKDSGVMQLYRMNKKYKFNSINEPVSGQSKLWSGWTPLHFAVCCNIESFKILLKCGADVTIKNAKGETAFDLGLRRHSPKVLLSSLSIRTVLSDQSTKLADLILAMDDHDTFRGFLMKNVNLRVPFTSQLWPGYNLLHASLSTYHKINFPQVFCQTTDYYSGTPLHDHLYSAVVGDTDYWSKVKDSWEENCSVCAKNSDGLSPIHLAVKLDEWHALECLLTNRWLNENVVGPNNVSFLHIACAMGKPSVVERLLAIRGADVDAPVTGIFECYRKPRSFYEMTNRSELRKVVVRANSTPLHIAVIFETEEVIEELLKNRADVHAKDSLGLTPLHLSLASTKSIARLLLRGASDLREVKREDGLSHLHVAAFADDEVATERLLRRGADVDGFVDNTVPDCLAGFAGKTPLHLAVDGERAARVLMDKGADLLAANPYWNRETPLDVAFRQLQSGECDFPFERLKGKFVRIDALTASGLTTLHVACVSMDLEWMRKLLARGANPNARMSDGRGRANAPMHLVIENAVFPRGISQRYGSQVKRSIRSDLRSFVELLVEHGALVDVSNNRETPLHSITNVYFQECWDSEDQKILLATAAWLLSNQSSYMYNHTDANGLSYFHLACMTNNLIVAKIYSNNGFDINHSVSPFARKHGGFTPLHFAIMHKNREIVQLLMERGADVNAEDSHGNTPLHLAIIADFSDLQLFDSLLRKRADINAKNLKNRTPIMCLLSQGNMTYEQFHFFMIRGSVIDMRKPIGQFDKEGIIGYMMKQTALSDIELVFGSFIEFTNVRDAISKGFLAIHNVVSVAYGYNKQLTRQHYLNAIQRLTAKGGDIDEQDENGKTALDKALSFNNFEAIDALLSLGANVNVVEDENGHSSVVPTPCCPLYVIASPRSCMAEHLRKMILVKLDLSTSIQKAMKNCELQSNNKPMQLYRSELGKIKRTKIHKSLTAREFLSEWRAVVEYPTMSLEERRAVDNFFARTDILHENFPEFAGLLTMQYRKALARMKLMKPVKDILVTSGIDLSDIVLEAILKYFKNSELSFLIENANEPSHSSKRQKTQ